MCLCELTLPLLLCCLLLKLVLLLWMGELLLLLKVELLRNEALLRILQVLVVDRRL
jgi:hypothetical protein